MVLRFTYAKRAVFTAAAVMACGSSLAVTGGAGAGAATTTTVVPQPSTTTTITKAPTTTSTAKPPTTTTTTQPAASATTTTSNVPAPTSPATPTTTPTTATPQHVVNQPNLNALTPHIVALRGSGVQYQASSGVSGLGTTPNVPSFLSSPGGPYLYDSQGRVVLMHGVNVVYKHAPYIAYPDPGEPWNFDAADAEKMQQLGFNVVRLGIEWQALEPGSGGPNQPQVCTPGAPGNAHEWNKVVAEQYLSHVAATVKLLARYGIYTLLDMHQDVYNQNFRGEGAPNWAVCTDNVPIVPKGGRWSNNYSNPTLQTAVAHFWSNDVIGNLQGNYDLVWKTVAQYFKNDRWVIGYDPYNEPFSTETQTASESTFTGQLECFYIGKAHATFLANGAGALTCPSGDPDNGVIPTIQSVDSHHLTFVEPDIYWVTGGNIPSQLGPLPFKRIVFNFHVYCGDRSPLTGNPTDLIKCLQSEETAASEQEITRLSMASASQSAGPAGFMSEFGATTSIPLAGFDVEWAGLDQLSWIYWAWKFYDDPTGSSAEGLVETDGTYSPVVTVLSRTYPQAVAGDPNSVIFNPFTGAFNMVYAPTQSARGVTTIAIAASEHYPHGWCSAVKGGRITSSPGATHLTVQTVGHPAQVYITVTAGACPSS
jgi:endoglycosylceramidase